MKLRLRSLETKETLRIEVPTPCSIQQLREVISQRIASSSASSSIHLSLNRKDELLSSSPQDSLQSLDVTSGDLIFFTLNPNGFSSETLTVQSQGPRSEQPQNSQQALILVPNSQKQQTSDSESLNNETLGLDTQMEGREALTIYTNSKNSESVNNETLGLLTQREKTLDMDTQMEASVENMEVDDGESVVETGKSFSVPGFLRKVFTKELGDDGGRHHKLLVIAVHAVLLESGFVGFDPVTNTVVNGFHLNVDEWPLSAFRMSLQYTIPEIIGHGRLDAVKLNFQSLGKFVNVYGSLVKGAGTHWVRVDEDQLVPFLNVVWANCGLVDDSIGNDGLSTISPEREVFKFWRSVKDRLALPLLIDLCEKAGLDLPPCFMRLPTDLKLKIFESLPGVDIAKVGCVCSELRYLTASDELWKQKFVEQFGNVEGSQGGGNWKEKFAKSLESRKRRETASNFCFSQRRRKLYPSRFPGIVGGDHDLWPHFGPPAPLGLPGRPNRRVRNPIFRCTLGDAL